MSQFTDTEQVYLDALEKWDAGDLAEAVALFQRGAALGNADSQNLLGTAYGDGMGVRKDVHLSLYWHKRAWAAQGRGLFCSNIAVACTRSGNRRQAEIWWRRAVARGDGDAAVDLAKYLLRTRRPQDVRQAIKMLKVAMVCREWFQISPAGREEAQELLLRIRKSRRSIHKYFE